MKEITVPCFINGRHSTQKLYIGDGCKEDISPIRSQEAYYNAKGITLSPDVVRSIIALRDLALAKGVSFEELTVLAYIVANKRIKGEIPDNAKVGAIANSEASNSAHDETMPLPQNATDAQS